MIHGAAEDNLRETAALYALGALSQSEARAFEDHLAADQCDVCLKELEAFDALALEIGLSADEAAPPPQLREMLVERIAPQASLSTQAEPSADEGSMLSIHGDEMEWTEVGPGILVKELYVDEARGVTTSLVKMLPGTSLPVHRHTGAEQFFIIEGDCSVHGEVLRQGDYHRAAPGTIHYRTYTDQGTLFLLIAPSKYEYLDQT